MGHLFPLDLIDCFGNILSRCFENIERPAHKSLPPPLDFFCCSLLVAIIILLLERGLESAHIVLAHMGLQTQPSSHMATVLISTARTPRKSLSRPGTPLRPSWIQRTQARSPARLSRSGWTSCGCKQQAPRGEVEYRTWERGRAQDSQ